jgi:hypothetical protein
LEKSELLLVDNVLSSSSGSLSAFFLFILVVLHHILPHGYPLIIRLGIKLSLNLVELFLGHVATFSVLTNKYLSLLEIITVRDDLLLKDFTALLIFRKRFVLKECRLSIEWLSLVGSLLLES